MGKKSIILFVAIFLLTINFILAQKINIEIKNSYLPGENANFKITLYDENNNKVEGEISYSILDYYSDPVFQGKANSGEELYYIVPEDAIPGQWSVVANYNNLEKKEIFNVKELEKADIKLIGDLLIITNTGNVPYKKSLQILINDNQESIYIPLEIGQKKEIKLTAPEGIYEVKINDGTQSEDIVFSDVTLTGNVIGFEDIAKKSFFLKYPIITLFFIAIVALALVISIRSFKRPIKR